MAWLSYTHSPKFYAQRRNNAVYKTSSKHITFHKHSCNRLPAPSFEKTGMNIITCTFDPDEDITPPVGKSRFPQREFQQTSAKLGDRRPPTPLSGDTHKISIENSLNIQPMPTLFIK